MRRLALSIDGTANGFPALGDVAAWVEALGLRAWIPGRSLAPPAADRIARELPGVALPAVRHLFPADVSGSRGDDLAGRELLTADERVRERAVGRLVSTARWALAGRATWVIVEPGSLDPFPAAPAMGGRGGSGADDGNAAERAQLRERDARLDRLCRSLHAASRQEPQASFALATPRDRPQWLTPAALELVFEELGSRGAFAYWHDAGTAHALAAQGAGPASLWLDRHAHRCVGLDATDAIGASAGLPAGAGEIDFPALLGAVGSSTWIAIRSEPFVGPGPLLGAVRHLGGGDR